MEITPNPGPDIMSVSCRNVTHVRMLASVSWTEALVAISSSGGGCGLDLRLIYTLIDGEIRGEKCSLKRTLGYKAEDENDHVLDFFPSFEGSLPSLYINTYQLQ